MTDEELAYGTKIMFLIFLIDLVVKLWVNIT